MNATLGIDVSRDWLDCALLDAGADRPRWERQVPRTAAGIARLARNTPEGVPWVMEPTGRYSQEVAQLARERGQQVLLAPTKAARCVLAGLRAGAARTDRTDSVGLARFAQVRRLRDYPLKSALMDEVDQLLQTRAALAATLSQLRAQQRDLPRAAHCYVAPVAALVAEVAALDRELDARMTTEPALAAARELDRVPGVGPVVALALASRLESRGFVHPDQFVAYCGLQLTYKDSGKKSGRRTLSKHGDAELRRLLYLAAMANLRCRESPFRDQYQRELAKGLPTTGALCAVARKLAKVCWSLHHHRATYDPQRVHRQPSAENRPTGDSGA